MGKRRSKHPARSLAQATATWADTWPANTTPLSYQLLVTPGANVLQTFLAGPASVSQRGGLFHRQTVVPRASASTCLGGPRVPAASRKPWTPLGGHTGVCTIPAHRRLRFSWATSEGARPAHPRAGAPQGTLCAHCACPSS